ncbi:MAG: hypothetical protein ACREWG_09255, partial [Gammaproteobacteria bacterium]
MTDPRHPRLGPRLDAASYPQAALDADAAITIGYSRRNVLAIQAFDFSRTAGRARTGMLQYPGTWTTAGDDRRMASYLPEQRLVFLPVVVKARNSA